MLLGVATVAALGPELSRAVRPRADEVQSAPLSHR